MKAKKFKLDIFWFNMYIYVTLIYHYENKKGIP